MRHVTRKVTDQTVADGLPAWPDVVGADDTVPVNDQQGVQLRVALAQVDTRVGDLGGNTELVRTWTAKAADAGAHLVVFPEMTLTGYPPEELVLR